MTRKKYVLFHAIAPESHQLQHDWMEFLRVAAFAELPEESERLAPNVWLLPDDREKSFLILSQLGQKHAVETQFLPFATGSDWQPLSRRP